VFTGIVKEQGRVRSCAETATGVRIEVETATLGETAVGGSVSINGVCLTVTARDGGVLTFDAVGETLARTTMGALEPGDGVNLEPALRAGEPLGGHYVQGHVDAVGTVRTAGGDGRIWIDAPAELLRYCVEKGSVAVEGVSLTISALDETGFEVVLIPHTLAETTLGALAPGREVNLEADVLAKYVERLLELAPK